MVPGLPGVDRSRTLRRAARTAGVWVVAGCAAGPAAGTAIPASARFHVPAVSDAQRTAAQWRPFRPADAAAMEYIARQPSAYWVGGWRGAVRADVASLLSRSRADGTVPVVVAYNIPHRDCGSHSRGGAQDGRSYRQWIDDFASALRGSRSVVIVEPDALAGADCLADGQQSERFALLRHAVSAFKGAGATVYLDAGHSRWHSAEVMAPRLRAAGIDRADGFALNVSNFVANSHNIAYGERLSRLVGGKKFVIDTSRNGAGTASTADWCNAPGQALGAPPTTHTGHPLVAAFLWIKVPGESDGQCRGGPPAGHWWPEYALELARRANVRAAD
jgi:endoglucanase